MAELKEWILRHLKHKDLVKKTIVEIVPDPEKKCDLIVRKTNGVQQVHLLPTLSLPNLDSPAIIVTENKLENVEFLIKEWQSFAALPQLWIYFVNSNATYWVINPYTHDRITEKASLALGIKTMFESSMQ